MNVGPIRHGCEGSGLATTSLDGIELTTIIIMTSSFISSHVHLLRMSRPILSSPPVPILPSTTSPLSWRCESARKRSIQRLRPVSRSMTKLIAACISLSSLWYWPHPRNVVVNQFIFSSSPLTSTTLSTSTTPSLIFQCYYKYLLNIICRLHLNEIISINTQNHMC